MRQLALADIRAVYTTGASGLMTDSGMSHYNHFEHPCLSDQELKMFAELENLVKSRQIVRAGTELPNLDTSRA